MMAIEMLLNDPTNSYLLFVPGKTNDVVIGVPHHAPLGIQSLPCESHPSSDENTGFIGYQLAQLLDCSCIIAGNYFLDANKLKGSDYFKKIESLQPRILIEIHGHSSRNANYDIEISSGTVEKTVWSEVLSKKLRIAMENNPGLRSYSISGDFAKIYFKARKSLTINTDSWLAFHIELPQKLRESKDEYEPFCKVLGEIIKELVGLL